MCTLLAGGGCIDSLNRWDSVTDSAGEAQAWNSMVHVVDPSPPAARRVKIEADGRRTENTMAEYRGESPAGAGGGVQENAAAAVVNAAGLGAGG